jgi:ATP-dependent DNA helicase RecQ
MTIDQTFHTYFTDIGEGVRNIQRRVIRSVVDGHNTLALMPTGSGKSLCYWIAGLELGGITLVISPLTALMDEQAQKLQGHGVKVVVLHSGINVQKQYRELFDLYNAQDVPDFIFLSPERLATDGFLEFVLQSIRDRIKLVTVDEAHCISQWGLDFRPFYKEIPFFLDNIFQDDPLPRILCLTATLNPMDQKEICEDLYIEEEHVIRHKMLLRREIDIQIVKVPDEDTKDERFWALMDEHQDEKVLIYVDRKRGKRSTEALCAQALEHDFKAAYFHGDMTSNEKLDVIRRFKTGELLTVFATSAFGMGIDIPDIRGVVHYLLTESAEQYYQQIGRAGRDGNPAWAVLYYSDRNVEVRKTWYIERSFPSEEDVQSAFVELTDERTGQRTVNYFQHGDETRSAYHYLVRSEVITPIAKGFESLSAFEPADGVTLPAFEAYQEATFSGALIPTVIKAGEPAPTILQNLFCWLAEGKIEMTRSPGKCLVIDVLQPELPDGLLNEIKADVSEKKAYRLDLFEEFVTLLESYTNTFEFHDRIGEYLGIDKFSLGKRHKTLSGDLVRSKSEVIIANILYENDIPFEYEKTLWGPDGTPRSPDFTINLGGETYYWEHLGMLSIPSYRRDWEAKKAWYDRYYPGQIITTRESSTLSQETKDIIASRFGVEPVESES